MHSDQPVTEQGPFRHEALFYEGPSGFLDGTVEAIEDPERRFLLGVLWHPEEDEADRLIGAFVRECGARTAGGPDRSGPPEPALPQE